MLPTNLMSPGSGWPVQSTLSAPRLPGDPMRSNGRTPFEQGSATSAASAAASSSTSLSSGQSSFAAAWLIGLAILLLALWSLLNSVKLRTPPGPVLSNTAPPG